MKKIVSVIIISFIFIFSLAPFAAAFENQGEAWYSSVWDSIDSETLKKLNELGFDEISTENFLNISPNRVFEMIVNIIKGEFFKPVSTAGSMLIIFIIVSLVVTFLPDKSTFKEPVQTIGLALIMFSLISSSGNIISDCLSSLTLTRDFMLALIPVFTGVIAFSGNPALAASFNTLVFSFAEGISVLFTRYMPAISAAGTGLAAAGALNPLMKFDGLTKVFAKAVTLIMSFIAGIFVAVLSIRGVIAGAADTVGIKGLRFIIGNAVPVVGSAIGEALNSVAAGLGLIKNTVGMLGIMVLIIINLPALLELILWKLCMYVLALAADILDNSALRSFIDSVNGMLSVILAAICFNMFVFVISIAIILTVKAG